MDADTFITWTIVSLMGLMISTIGFFIVRSLNKSEDRFKNIYDKIEAMSKKHSMETQIMKEDYLSRFDKVNEKMTTTNQKIDDIRLEIINKLGDLKVDISEIKGMLHFKPKTERK